MTTFRVTTEGDCEGRSTRFLGNYNGTVEQIVSLMLKQGKQPMYTYGFEMLIVDNASNEKAADGVTIEHRFQNSFTVRVDVKKNKDAILLEEAMRKVRDLSPEHLRILKEHLNA